MKNQKHSFKISTVLISFLLLMFTASNSYASSRNGTIANFVASANGLGVLEFALEAEGLLETLNSRKQRFTLFAPTDEAFQALADACPNANGDIETLATALIGAGILDDVLLYHVANYRQGVRAIVKRGSVHTLIGEDLTSGIGNGGINVKGNFNASPSNIVSKGIRVRNGIIYPIDQVLLNVDPTGLCT